jgi:hypothetical protein
MLLNELFKKSVPYKVIKNTSSKFGTSAVINGREIRFYAIEDEGGEFDEWNVSFGQVLPNGKPTAKMTGSGGELDVLAMVKDSLNDFINTRHPKAIHFTASKDDRSRAAVYERMLKRLMPSGWTYDKSEHGDDVFFTMVKS